MARLNPKEKEFCRQYVNRRNAVQAYLNAYGGTYNAAAVGGCRLLKKDKIQSEIDRLRAEAGDILAVEPNDLLKFCIRVLNANIADYYTTDQNGQLTARPPSQCDMSIVKDIKPQKGAPPHITLYSKEWALDKLDKYLHWTENRLTVEHAGNMREMFEGLTDDELRQLAKIGTITHIYLPDNQREVEPNEE